MGNSGAETEGKGDARRSHDGGTRFNGKGHDRLVLGGTLAKDIRLAFFGKDVTDAAPAA